MVATQSPLKRKRGLEREVASAHARKGSVTLQIITGSYERVLHGLVATLVVSDDKFDEVTFSDQFLFNAHASSIRCLALSPGSDKNLEQQSSKRILATGGADERINLYSISTSVPRSSSKTVKEASILPISAAVDSASRNHEVGSLLHHSSTIMRLHFVSRGKLLSASLDNTIAISRARDWTVLSTIRAPIPKAAGRPSGDTATPGEVPAGINDVAVHPSAKLCLSVGQGERCMRLWNLVTGKKAGVLTFEKPVLSLLGESRWRGGEGRSVVWSTDGEEFAVGFERGAVVYGLDCQVRGVARVNGSKICGVRYVPQFDVSRTTAPNGTATEDVDEKKLNILAISTEDGRILFFHSNNAKVGVDATVTDPDAESLLLETIGQLGGVSSGNRIKDFHFFQCPDLRGGMVSSEDKDAILVVTGSSDGAVSIWEITVSELIGSVKQSRSSGNLTTASEQKDQGVKPVGTLLGTYQTSRRITCLTGFQMQAASSAEVDETSATLNEEEGWEGFDDNVEDTGQF